MISARRILPAIGIALCTHAAPAASQFDNASLRGLRHVALAIEKLHPDLAAVTDTAGLRTEMELKLREHGLTVVTPGDTNHIDGVIYLNIDSVHNTAIGVWALSVDVDVWQALVVTRLNLIEPYGTTWSDGYMDIVGDNFVAQSVVHVASDSMDAFLNAWLQVNPPPTPPTR